jgi:hypothetical protein
MKFAIVPLAALLCGGCGEVARTGRSPVQVVIQSLQAASGATPERLGGTLNSDVITLRRQPDPCTPTSPCATIYSDAAQVVMALLLKDPGAPGVPSSPSELNQVTFTRYRVTFRRHDRANGGVPGVDVPHPFDSAVTFTVPNSGTVSAGFELVRHTAKEEAPLAALRVNDAIISTVADISFYGRDQAGNDVIATGSIGVLFGNFGDPN